MKFLGIDTDALLAPLMNKVETMSQQVSDLTTAVSTLTTTVQAAIATETALKQKLDAAIQENARLTQQLKDAQAGQSDPVDAAAIAAATTKIQQNTQSLADANAVNAVTN